MRLAIETVAYHEERFISKFIQHYQNKVETILVLHSAKPWNGDQEPDDKTANIAESLGAEVISYDWPNEETQRNAGLDFLSDYDWVLVLDPDEFISNDDWDKLVTFLETCEAPGAIVEGQYTYWKNGYVADPPRDYPMLIAVKPKETRFVDKRVINTVYTVAPVWMHHFSWAKTDEEVWRKISHYAHAHDFPILEWYERVWLDWNPAVQDVHPVTPETLHHLIKAKLPKEIEELDLWPQ